MKRGEIWWARLPPPRKTKPVLLVSRGEAYARRAFVMVAPVTTNARELRSEIPVGPAEGLPRESVANCESLETIARALLFERVGALAPGRIVELDAALTFALGID
jgi:mRNA interferase MazF